MEKKFLVKPCISKPVIVGIVGVFSTNYSSSVFFSKGFEELDSVKSVFKFDYRKGLSERINFIQNMVSFARQVDLMIIMKGNGIPLQAFKLCSKYCTTLFWMMDTYSHFSHSPMMLENSIFCDYRTATGYGTCKLWEEKTNLPVHHVLDGSSISTYYPSKSNKQYDVSFIGGSDRERDSIYKFLKNRYRVKFFGPKYSNIFIKPKEFRQICCKSRIVLNISRGHYDGYSSLRLWNLLACGSMVLTKKIPKMTEYMGLEADKHIVEFNSFIELTRKIDYYLKNDDARNKIAENGLKFLRSHRTWKHSAQDIIDLISTTKGKSLILETPGLVIPKKRRVGVKNPKSIKKLPNKNPKIKSKRLPKKKKVEKTVGVSRRVKAGWITA